MIDERGRAEAAREAALEEEHRGDWEAAIGRCREALELYDAAGDRRGQARAGEQLARLRAKQGDLPGALDLLRQVAAMHAETGDRAARAGALVEAAQLHARLVAREAAIALYDQARLLFEALGDTRAAARALEQSAFLRIQQGELCAAHDLLRRALAGYDKLGDASAGVIARDALRQLPLPPRGTRPARPPCMKQKKHSANESGQTGPHTVPPSEVGRGAGLDPESPPPDREAESRDEAYANRPSRSVEKYDPEDEAAAIQRPPADS